MSKPNIQHDDERDLINQNMLVAIDQGKAARNVLKQLIRYPLLGGKLSDLEPNIFFGYSDHPLDANGIPPLTVFTFLRRQTKRKAHSVLSTRLMKRDNNSFHFIARGYDVFKIRNFNTLCKHEYLVNEKTAYASLTLRIDFIRADVYRLRLAKGDEVPENKTPMIYADITDPTLAVRFDEHDDRYTIASDAIRLEIYKEHFRIEIFDAAGRLVTESGGKTKTEWPSPLDAFPLGFIHEKKSKRTYGVDSFILYPGEHIYGLGEGFGYVNKAGQTTGLWNIDATGNTSGRSYKHVPFFMSTQGYGVFINESRPITYWVGSRETCKNMFAVEGDLIDYYFFYGPSFKSILNTYTDLTGKAAMPPKWSFGTWMSRISYYSQDQVMAVARKLRAMKFPADVIHIDTGWFDEDWRCDWKFNPKRFPDPEKMFADAAGQGFKLCLWQTPYVLKETGIYKNARKEKALAKNHGPFAFLGMFAAAPIDFSRPEGIRWYKEVLRKLLMMGAQSIKIDFGEQIDPHQEFARYDGRQMHNLYALLYQKAGFEILEETKGAGNAVIWARSAYAGSQRYPVHWSGDNSANHENLLSSLRGGLSLGLSGFTFWSQDTGGFVGVPTEEVYIRWTQLSIFQSHIRFHGNPPHYKEPWNFTPLTQDIVREYLHLRYRLIPYLFSESIVSAQGGLPLLRHLAIEFQDDPTTFAIEDQFMCGRNLLVAPILTKNNSRRIYLPAGLWYDFWTGEAYSGNQWITRDADLKTIPVYGRGGSILPLAVAVQSTDDLTLDGMTLVVYPGADSIAQYTLVDQDRQLILTTTRDQAGVAVKITPAAPPAIAVLLPGGAKPASVTINGEIC